MEPSGGLSNLTERLKEKAEQERIQTEKVFTEQLQSLSSSLQASSQNALNTMSDAMAQEITNATERLNQRYRLLSMAFGKQWLYLTTLGIAFCLGILLTGWLLTELGDRRLNRHRNELAQLEQKCQTQRDELRTLQEAVDMLSQTFTTLMDKTSGVVLLERDGNRYIIAPQGSESGHTIGNRPAIKLKG
jgi:hypothetical protein